MRKGLAAASIMWAVFSSLAACGPGTTPMDDAGATTDTPAPTDTVVRDVPPAPEYFNACTAPGMCMGTMARCDSTFPGGSCTIRCTTARP